MKLTIVIGTVIVLLGAMPGWSLTVSPGRTEIRLSPGDHAEGMLTTTNDTADRLKVTLSTKDWFVLDANKAKKLTVDTWLKLLGKKEFYLKPGQKRDVKFVVTCPKEAEGELVGMASFMNVSNPNAMTTPMISVSIYVEAAGTEKRAGEIEQLGLRNWKNQIQAAVAVKSTGNVHLRPTGTISIVKEAGEPVARWDVKEGGPAYPGNSQGYFAAVPADFKLAPGRYKAQADLTYRDLVLKAERDLTVLKDGTIQMDQKPK